MSQQFNLSDVDVPGLVLNGVSGAESDGRWTDGPTPSIAFKLPEGFGGDLLISFEVAPFVSPGALPEQTVEIKTADTVIEKWQLTEQLFRQRTILIRRNLIPPSNEVMIDFFIPNCRQPAELGLNQDRRYLGIMIKRLWWEEIAEVPPKDAPVWQYGRPVGAEARKSFDQKIESGFWSKFVRGPAVLDIGFKGYGDGVVLPILDGAIGVDIDYPGYDGRTLPFATNSQDAVYSSHCLEHIPDYLKAIQEWHRVTKVGGHIITVVPSAQLYERRRRPPSRHNDTHIRFYTPASLLAEFEAALAPNTYRVRHLVENDRGYNYSSDPEEHPSGCYEIELVIEKIEGPTWTLAD